VLYNPKKNKVFSENKPTASILRIDPLDTPE